MTSSKSLAQTLRRLQEERGLTCVEFAAELGVGKTTVYNLRSGRGHFSSATLDQIAGKLHLPPAVLLGGNKPLEELCESVLRTCGAAGKLRGVEREKALHYLKQLMELLA